MSFPEGFSEITPGTGTRLRPRSAIATDAPILDLSGRWDFRWSPRAGAPLDFLSSDALCQRQWKSIDLPAHWVMPGQPGNNAPIYTNMVYPFPVDPPYVPDENPLGDHRLVFDLPVHWPADGATHLRTEGIESWAKIWVNGQEIGTRSGSRLVQDFDVSDALRRGPNVLAIRVHAWSAGSYLEDQDQWWLPGIFRTLSLRHRPAGALQDVWPRAGYSEGEGSLDPEIKASDAAWPVDLEIPELGIKQRWNSPSDVSAITVGPVRPWSAEDPYLYSATVRSVDEEVTVKVGFRSIEINDGRLMVNGKSITLRGVNRHEFNTSAGRVIDMDEARAELIAMKAANIDAVRTAHQPPDPRWLDLADELGIWVMLECDLETHGFEFLGWQGNPADDPAWRDVFIDRIERTVERDKHHPSIILWSLGNESDDGANLAAMGDWVHQRDPSRPVHYEGDRRGAYTDVYSRMYPALEEIRAWQGFGPEVAVPHHPAAAIDPQAMARVRSMPYIMVEYLHAMGTGPGGALDYAQIVESDERIAGGFVWEWKDHSITVEHSDASSRQLYGGDFKEVVHDGNFVCDGLVLSNGVPTPGLAEWSETIAPVRARWSEEEEGRAIVVESLRSFTSMDDLRLVWLLEVDGAAVASGTLPLNGGPRTSTTLSVPPALEVALQEIRARSEEVWLTLSMELGEDTPWAPAGHRISERQFKIRIDRTECREGKQSRQSKVLPPRAHGKHWVLGDAQFDEYGSLVRMGKQRIADHGIDLWRTPTDNDEGHGALDYEAADPRETLGAGGGRRGPSSADRWRTAGLDRMTPRTVSVAAVDEKLVVITRSSPAGWSHGIQTRYTWQAISAGSLTCAIEIEPYGLWPGTWPRVGYHLELPLNQWQVQWFGLGPGESWPDMFSAVRVGKYSSTIEDLSTQYVRPQASGHRSATRWLELRNPAGDGISIERISGDMGFSVSDWSPSEANVAHSFELPQPTGTHLHLDFAQHGIGSRACGPDVRPQAQLWPKPINVKIRLSTLIAQTGLQTRDSSD